MASITSTPNAAGEPGPPHVVRFRWKPDADGVLRAGRETFQRIDTAKKWVRGFDEAKEEGGWPGVKAYVEAWRARDAEAAAEVVEPTLAEFMVEWFRRDIVGVAAQKTQELYLATYNNHIRALPVDARAPDGEVFGERPLSEFAKPYIHVEFRESLRLTGRPKATQDVAKKVLSSALSWGVQTRTYEQWLPTNGSRQVITRRRRGDLSEQAEQHERDLKQPRSRVFNAFDYELVRAALLARTGQRTWQPHRDAAMLDLQFGAGERPEEARGHRWGDVLWPGEQAEGTLRVRRVVVSGRLIPATKTKHSIRDAPLPAPIAERLREWREIAAAAGLPTGANDFIIPGEAPYISKRQPGGHFTESQERRWGDKFLRGACRAVAAAHAERGYLVEATQYAGRRGYISSRLAAGDSVPAVADDCGTSRKTITGHYHEDLGDEFPRPYPPFAEQLVQARDRFAPPAAGRHLKAV